MSLRSIMAGLLISLICVSGAIACESENCDHQPPVQPCTDCGDTTTISTEISSETDIAGAGGFADNGGVNAASNGDLEVNTENHEVEGFAPGGEIIGVVDSPGAKVETNSEEIEVNGEDNIVADDGGYVSQIEIEVEDSFNNEQETEAEVGDDGQAGAITGDGNTLVQIGEVEVNVEGDDVNSHNTEIYRTEITNIDQSVEITNIDNSQTVITSITEIDNSVKQVIQGDVTIGDVKNINVNGVQVPVTVIGVNTNGDIIVNVDVHVDGQPKQLEYIVKHKTVYVNGGVSGFIMAPAHAGHVKKVDHNGELLIVEAADNLDCTKTFEVTAVGGDVKVVGGKMIVSDASGAAVIVPLVNDFTIRVGEHKTIDVDFEGMVGTVQIKSKNGVSDAMNFDLNGVPAGYSLQLFPETKMGIWGIAKATLKEANIPPAAMHGMVAAMG